MSADIIQLVITELSDPAPVVELVSETKLVQEKKQLMRAIPSENTPMLGSILDTLGRFRHQIRELTKQCMRGELPKQEYDDQLSVIIEKMQVAETTFRDILAGREPKHLV